MGEHGTVIRSSEKGKKRTSAKKARPTLSVAFVLKTYNGGATSFALIGTLSLLAFSPARRALWERVDQIVMRILRDEAYFLMASIPRGV